MQVAGSFATVSDAEHQSAPKVALVHDWLVSQRGGENVLLQLAKMFPTAPIFTLVHQKHSVDPLLEMHEITTSFIQKLPGAPKRFRHYLPLFPTAIERFDFSKFDIVISTSHCVAHGISTHKQQAHIAYVHTPMRYLYDQMDPYLPKFGRFLWRPMFQRLSGPLRHWDKIHAQSANVIVANSRYVAKRIETTWNRGAQVVYPPVDVGFFAQQTKKTIRKGLVVVSALVPYKRVEVAVAFANRYHVPLTVIGRGAQLAQLQRLAGQTVIFRQGLTREQLRDVYQSAEALLFTGEEDFGIVPVEAMAAGCPVIAWGRGGLLETVVDEGPGSTGVLFAQNTVEAIAEAWQTLRYRKKHGHYQVDTLRRHASGFDVSVFAQHMHAIVQQHWQSVALRQRSA